MYPSVLPRRCSPMPLQLPAVSSGTSMRSQCRAALVEPAGVEAVAHVLPQPVVGKRVRIVLLRRAQQVVRHVVVEPVADETETEDAAVVGEVAVHVRRAFPRDDRLQRRRAQARHQPLVHGEVGDAAKVPPGRCSTAASPPTRCSRGNPALPVATRDRTGPATCPSRACPRGSRCSRAVSTTAG